MDRTQPHTRQIESTHTGGEAAETVREQFAANLRRLRVRAGISQEGLAGVCDLHRSEVSLLERCKRSPRLETIVTLSRGLELASPGELLDSIV